MNKKIWESIQGLVGLDNYPKLPCPHCGEHELFFDVESIQVKAISADFRKVATHHLKKEEEKRNLKQKNEMQMKGDLFATMWSKSPAFGIVGALGLAIHEATKPNMEFGQFTSFMQCDSCKEYVAVSGLCEQQKTTKNTPTTNTAKPLFKVEYFSIPIPLFSINEAVPYSVEIELLSAFGYFHFDPAASANKLRRAMERYCSELGANAKTLHLQIDSLKNSYPQEARYLNTLKLVGNEGSHADEVDENDLITAFEIFYKVLDVFERNAELKKLEMGSNALEKKFGKTKV